MRERRPNSSVFVGVTRHKRYDTICTRSQSRATGTSSGGRDRCAQSRKVSGTAAALPSLNVVLDSVESELKYLRTCRTRKWEAHIWKDGKQIYLGSFPNEPTAARAYDIVALKFRGKDASLNFPDCYSNELNVLSEASNCL